MKPKSNKPRGGGYDNCGTPTYALKPLLPYLRGKVVWESASGEDHLITTALRDWGRCRDIIETGCINQGEVVPEQDFFTISTWFSYDIQLTNPPYSLKYEWLARSYSLGKPFALLLPVETLGAQTAQNLFRDHGMQLMLLSRRVNFKMPNKGWDCSAQFPTAWFTFGLGLPQDINIASIDNRIDPLTPLKQIP